MKDQATENDSNFSEAVFGGGCFWCLEAIFARLKGVKSAVSGYAGGHAPAKGKNPTYEEVSGGRTGHAEVVHVEFDPKIISYHDLLAVFFALHEPTTLNRQGADIGTQYRSIIFYYNEKQKKIVEEFVKELENEKVYGSPIVTEIKKLEKFFPAEDYHQKYFEKNPCAAYCQFNISPKIAKLRQKFQKLLK